MSILTANAPRVAKTSHTTAIAAALVALPVLLLVAAAYGSAAVHAAAQVARGLGSAAAGSSQVSISVAFAAIVGIIALAITVAVREFFADEDKEIDDVR